MPPKLRFERFEFKYVLDVDVYARVKKALARFLVPDFAVEGLPHGFYEVISLYYDSPRFCYYWEKIDGASRRKKIRVRTYRRNGRDFSPDIFLEIKRKRDAVILKDRLSLNKSEFGKNLKFEICNLKLDDARSRRVHEEYLLEEKSRCLAPKVLIAYSREPYVGKYNQNVRITFDYGIRAKRTNDLFAVADSASASNASRFADVSGTKVVMEVKFKGALPFYIDRILKDFNLSRVPYSKYCLGVEACYSLPLLAMLANKSQSETLNLRRGHLVS